MPALPHHSEVVRTTKQGSPDGTFWIEGLAIGVTFALIVFTTTLCILNHYLMRRRAVERYLLPNGRHIEAPRLWEACVPQSKGIAAVTPAEWRYWHVSALQSCSLLGFINHEHHGSRFQSTLSINLPSCKLV